MTTKPGILLKHQIPVRTFADWDERKPVFLEADLVTHCGEGARGEYLYTLTAVDVDTRWCELEVLPSRGQQAVREAIDRIRQRPPFPLLGLDSDNDSAFLNENLSARLRRTSLFKEGLWGTIVGRQPLQPA